MYLQEKGSDGGGNGVDLLSKLEKSSKKNKNPAGVNRGRTNYMPTNK